ncbi:MAG: alpha-ketoglutarate-dependent dioxygenase AlkB [Bacteroidota bacterium]
MELFQEDLTLNLPDADVVYIPQWLSPKVADHAFSQLRREVPWQQDEITVFGKTYDQPRLTALFGNNGKPYSYSNITMHPHPFTGLIKDLKEKVAAKANIDFTTCLLNLYRNGRDSNGWHADDEKELGQNPVIASVSLGQERNFHFRHKQDKNLKHKMTLQHGSLLLMRGTTQHFWQHQVPKTARAVGERINLTFRVIQ